MLHHIEAKVVEMAVKDLNAIRLTHKNQWFSAEIILKFEGLPDLFVQIKNFNTWAQLVICEQCKFRDGNLMDESITQWKQYLVRTLTDLSKTHVMNQK